MRTIEILILALAFLLVSSNGMPMMKFIRNCMERRGNSHRRTNHDVDGLCPEEFPPGETGAPSINFVDGGEPEENLDPLGAQVAPSSIISTSDAAQTSHSETRRNPIDDDKIVNAASSKGDITAMGAKPNPAMKALDEIELTESPPRANEDTDEPLYNPATDCSCCFEKVTKEEISAGTERCSDHKLCATCLGSAIAKGYPACTQGDCTNFKPRVISEPPVVGTAHESEELRRLQNEYYETLNLLALSIMSGDIISFKTLLEIKSFSPADLELILGSTEGGDQQAFEDAVAEYRRNRGTV